MWEEIKATAKVATPYILFMLIGMWIAYDAMRPGANDQLTRPPITVNIHNEPTAPKCYEDQPCWNPSTMGNRKGTVTK